jgi:hypothetical protein
LRALNNNQGALVVKLPAMFFAVASTYTGAHEMFSGCYNVFSPACHVLISTAMGLIGSCVYLLLSSADWALVLWTTVHNTTPTTMECLRFFQWINYIGWYGSVGIGISNRSILVQF